jgi:hypothetical protein
MSGFDKLKTAVIVLIVGGMRAGALWQYLQGTVDLHLVVDEGRQVRLSIDGQPIALASGQGQHLRFGVAR